MQINIPEATSGCIDWIKRYAEDTGLKKVIIGMSGGKDSYVAAALCCKALGSDNVLGLIIPNGEQKDIDDAILSCTSLDMDYSIINIDDIYDRVIRDIEIASINVSKKAEINIAPRIRMTILYTVAQSIGARVCGTGNLSERVIGYCTKHGDMACDFNPLANFTSIEVIAIGKYLGLESRIIDKAPEDGLTGRTDEEVIGITYNDIHNFLRYGNTGNIDTDMKIVRMSDYSRHKLEPIPTYIHY